MLLKIVIKNNSIRRVVLFKLMAADALNITQPAVTQHIKYPEEYYGCRLFLYNNRKLSITLQGEILRHYVYSQNYQEQKLVEKINE